MGSVASKEDMFDGTSMDGDRFWGIYSLSFESEISERCTLDGGRQLVFVARLDGLELDSIDLASAMVVSTSRLKSAWTDCSSK